MMTSTQLKGLIYIEQHWHRTGGKWPKVINVEGFNLDEAMENESFIRGLFNRGITPPANLGNDRDLSAEQMSAILVAVDYEDRRSLPSKLRSMGIKTATWNGWMQDKNFKDMLHGLSSRNFESALHTAQEGLLSAVGRGDVSAIKYWNQLTGREVTPEVQNLRVLVSHLIQVIQTHVKDEATLMAISRDFEAVMRGESPKPVVMIERTL